MGKLRGTVAAAFAALAAAATLSGCGTGGGAEAGGTLSVAVLEPYSAYPLHVAVEQGYFAEAGISEVEATQFTSVPAAMSAIAKGQIDIGAQSLPAIVNYNSSALGDNQLRMLTSFGVNLTSWSAPTGSDVPIAAETSWEETVRAWRGRTIGVPVLGGMIDQDLRYMLTRVGIDPATEVSIVAVGAQQAAVAAFEQGSVDILGNGSTAAALLRDNGTGYIALGPGDGPAELRGNIASSNWVTSVAQLAAEPDLFRGVVEALTRAREFIADPANREAAVSVLVDEVGLPREVAEIVYETDREGIARGRLDADSYARSVDALVATGSLAEADAPSYDQVVAAQVAG